MLKVGFARRYTIGVSRFILAAWTCAGLLVAADPVRTGSGLLRGVEEEGIPIYRGVPYAAPPAGELR